MMDIFEVFTRSDDQVSDAKAEAREKFRRLTWFMRSQARAPKLGHKTERRLIRDARKGCGEASRQLVESHFDFLASIAHKTARQSNCEHLAEDIFSTAMDAFIQAIRRFDPKRDARLNTFVSYAVTGACRQYALSFSGPITRGKSSDERKAWFRRHKIRAAFRGLHGREPENCERDLALMSDISGIPTKALQRGVFGAISTTPVQEVEIVSEEPSVEEIMQRSQGNDVLAQAFDALRGHVSTRDYAITSALRDEDDVSLADLGRRHGISAERVGQIVRQSAAILRRELADRGIERRSDLA